MCTTSQTVTVGRRGAENAEADAADEAYVNDIAVAEASSAEIDGDAGWENEVETGGLWRREEGDEQVLEEG